MRIARIPGTWRLPGNFVAFGSNCPVKDEKNTLPRIDGTKIVFLTTEHNLHLGLLLVAAVRGLF